MNSKILLTAMAFAMIGGGFGVPSYRHVNKNSKIDDIMEQLVKHGSAIIDNSDFGYLYKILPSKMRGTVLFHSRISDKRIFITIVYMRCFIFDVMGCQFNINFYGNNCRMEKQKILFFI